MRSMCYVFDVVKLSSFTHILQDYSSDTGDITGELGAVSQTVSS